MNIVESTINELKEHPFTSIQLSDKEKFHTGMLKLLIEYAASIEHKSDLQLFTNDSFNKPICELEQNYVDLLIMHNGTKTIVESKFKTGLHLSNYKGNSMTQIQKYASQHTDAKYGFVVSLFRENNDLHISEHKHIKEFKNITYTNEVLQFLDDTLKQPRKEENSNYFLLKLWSHYLSNLKTLADLFEERALDSINIPNLQVDLEKLKLKGVFQQYRMFLINKKVSEISNQHKGVLGNTRGNALLHYEKPFSGNIHNLEKYGIQWQNGKIKFYIELYNKPLNSIEDSRDKALDKMGSDLFEMFFSPLEYEKPAFSRRSGKFKSINIADQDEFGDINNVAQVLVNCLDYLYQHQDRILNLIDK